MAAKKQVVINPLKLRDFVIKDTRGNLTELSPFDKVYTDDQIFVRLIPIRKSLSFDTDAVLDKLCADNDITCSTHRRWAPIVREHKKASRIPKPVHKP